MTTKHTPGPWIVDYGDTKGHVKSIAVNPDGYTPTVARYDTLVTSISDSEKAANAALIAAAPELLEALEMVESLLIGIAMTDYPVTDELEKVTAAIAKAKGEAK
jgi:hypothetical protein